MRVRTIILTAILSFILNVAISAQSTEFTFQGKLTDQNAQANGVYDLMFQLLNPTDIQLGNAIVRDDVQVINGVFTVKLDFGAAAFDGTAKFLEIAIRPGASTGSYTVLTPRQPIASVPYSIRSLSTATADTATNATQLGGVNASQFVQTDDPRLSDARTPAPGSTSYIQNGTTQQASSSFNISGNGIVGGKLGVGLTNPLYALHVRGQDVRVESRPDGTFPRFSLNFTGGNPDEKKWQNYASGNSLNFTALNDSENQEIRWLGVNRLGLSVQSVVFPNSNVGIGTDAPQTKLHVVGQDIRIQSIPSAGIIPRYSLVYTAGSADAKKWQNYANGNSLVFSALNDAETVEQPWLRVNRFTGTNIFSTELVGGWVRIQNLISGGSNSICRDSSNQLAVCSSSIRYKKNVEDYRLGLGLIEKLRPVSFNWKADDMFDLGLIAEEVAKVEPLLVTHNDKGEIEGVKYDRVGVVLLNAVKQQQSLIESQQKQIDELRRVVVRLQRRAPARRTHR